MQLVFECRDSGALCFESHCSQSFHSGSLIWRHEVCRGGHLCTLSVASGGHAPSVLSSRTESYATPMLDPVWEPHCQHIERAVTIYARVAPSSSAYESRRERVSPGREWSTTRCAERDSNVQRAARIRDEIPCRGRDSPSLSDHRGADLLRGLLKVAQSAWPSGREAGRFRRQPGDRQRGDKVAPGCRLAGMPNQLPAHSAAPGPKRRQAGDGGRNSGGLRATRPEPPPQPEKLAITSPTPWSAFTPNLRPPSRSAKWS